MEPGFRLGDLIIAIERSSYQVGDAVVYQHPEGGHIFHRIIDIENGLHTFQGDNNTWVDSFQVIQNDIYGKLWLHIPFGGNVINFLRTPRNMTVLLIVIMLTYTSGSKVKQNRKSKSRQYSKGQKEEVEPKASVSSNFEGIIVLGVIALAALILGFVAFRKPAQIGETSNIQYNHVGVLLYNADDSQDLYDAESVQTGEPVFLQLTCDLKLFYGYQFVSTGLLPPEEHGFSGTYRITAEISDPNGWNRSIELAPVTEFRGAEFTVGMHMDLCHISSLIADMEEKSGAKNSWYNLSIYPKSYIVGSVAGHQFEDSFAPSINFEVNKFLMRLPREMNGDATDSFTPVKAGFVPFSSLRPNTLNFLGLQVLVISARMISVLGFGACLFMIIWLGWPLYQEWKRGDASRIRVQYEPMLVDVQPGSISPNGQAVPVDSFDDLAKLAERYGAMILCENGGELNKYWVQDSEVMYEYILDSSEKSAAMMGKESLNQAIVDAVALEEFQLYFQPIVSTSDGQIEGFEALLRWFHPENGVMYPAEFIAQAEEQGTLVLIDNWVIDEACKRIKNWLDMEIQFVFVSVNVSPNRFLDNDFAKWVQKTLKRCGCYPQYLQLEINRANLILDEEIAIENLHKLKKLGVRLAIDNFTAANSNQVDSLTLLPVDSLKIDRKLLHRILLKPEDSRLVGAVVKMAKDLELYVVAEGVETQEQLDFLNQHQIDAAQGYFTGRPMSVEDITQILDDGEPIPQ